MHLIYSRLQHLVYRVRSRTARETLSHQKKKEEKKEKRKNC